LAKTNWWVFFFLTCLVPECHLRAGLAAGGHGHATASLEEVRRCCQACAPRPGTRAPLTLALSRSRSLSLSHSRSLALSLSHSLSLTHTRGLQADDLYIQKLFSKKTKDDALQMMEHLRQAFVENLNSVCCVCVCVRACACMRVRACVCVRACACTDSRGATTGELDGQ